MDGTLSNNPRVRRRELSLAIVVFALSYYVAARLGLVLDYEDSHASPVWPASGLALAVLLWLGPRAWPGVLIGAFAANIVAGWTNPELRSLQVEISASIICVGNTLEAFLGASLIRRFTDPRDLLARPADVFRFTGIALLVSVVGSTIGSSAVMLAGHAEWTKFVHIWFTWWVGDSVGILVVTPFILAWLKPWHISSRWSRRTEIVALLLTLVLITGLVFGGWSSNAILQSMPFLIVPPLLWVTFRFGRHEATFAIVLISVISIWGTARGHGPFAVLAENQSLLLLQLYVGAAAVGAALLTAAYNQVKQTERALADEKKRIQVMLDSIGDAVVATDSECRVSYLNPVAETLTGWTADEAIGFPLSAIYRVVRDDTREPLSIDVANVVASSRTGGTGEGSALLINRLKREYHVEHSLSPLIQDGNPVAGIILAFRDVTRERLMAREIAHDANHDGLTGLANRREFERRIEHALSSARNYGRNHVLCYLDLDQFKLVNDTVGHAAGDQVLKEIRAVLSARIRERDTLARLGGDEFGLLFDNCPLEVAVEIGQSMVNAVGNHRFVWDGRLFQLGVSIGLVPVNATAASVATLLSQADVACYTAKELGRGQLHVYHEADSEPARRHLEIVRAAELRDALEKNRFRLYYQPIVALNPIVDGGNRYELLLRLVGKDGNLLLPDQFIPPAERFGLMGTIDRWVVRTAFRRYIDIFGVKSDTSITVNLSGNSLSDDSLSAFIHRQFSESGVPPKSVCFEITETAAIHDLHHAQRFVASARRLGCQLALDDFGSGLSSFAYLKNLKVDYLKIDGSFVRHIADNHVDLGMVAAINQVGHIMRTKTIAEYAHSKPVVDKLRELGVDYAQGFYLGRPAMLDGGAIDKAARH